MINNQINTEGFSEGHVLDLDTHYKIIKKIGSGGMGLVYLAENKKLIDQRFVIKTLKPTASNDNKIKTRFNKEWEALARINHDGVLKVFGKGTDIGTNLPYLVLEYVEGENLAEFIKNNKEIDVAECVYIVKQIALALNAVHKLRVYHRDLKPSNIMINIDSDLNDFRDIRIKLVDFGIAKVEESITGKSSHILFAGTPNYAAPEQLSGDFFNEQSEVFSLAAIAYEMLTNQIAVYLESKNEIEEAKAFHEENKFLPLRKFRNELPNEVEEIFKKAFSKDYKNRYKKPTEFALALELCFSGKKQNKKTKVDYEVGKKSDRNFIKIILLLIFTTVLVLLCFFVYKYIY